MNLPLPDDAVGGGAFDIDEDGTIVGHYGGGGGVHHASVWPPGGTAHRLPLPDGTGPFSHAHDIRGGWITGYAEAPGGVVPLRWHIGSGDVRAVPRLQIAAGDVNAHGWMSGEDGKGTAMLVAGDGDLPLPSLAGHGGETGTNSAAVLSDDGRALAGYSQDADGGLRAVRWRCR